jgi:sialate O-acetylesterase
MIARAVLGLSMLAACAPPTHGGAAVPAPRRAATLVVCLGDSITAGYGASSPAAAYPAVLQRLLGPGVVVDNFGHLGAALAGDADIPYLAQPEYAAAQQLLADAGASAVVDVVIELGANDARPPNWKGPATVAAFATGYDALIAALAAARSHPRVILVLPAQVTPGNEFEIDDGALGNQIAPQIMQLAARHHLAIVDLRTPAIARGADGAHPSDAGYAQIAELVRAAIAQ